MLLEAVGLCLQILSKVVKKLALVHLDLIFISAIILLLHACHEADQPIVLLVCFIDGTRLQIIDASDPLIPLERVFAGEDQVTLASMLLTPLLVERHTKSERIIRVLYGNICDLEYEGQFDSAGVSVRTKLIFRIVPLQVGLAESDPLAHHICLSDLRLHFALV